MNTAVYCLARGHESFFGYRPLIKRNRSLRRSLSSAERARTAFLIFHEGDIGWSHKVLVTLLSGLSARWIDISSLFKPFANQALPTDSSMSGYSLMCRFQYLQVWQLLENFELAVRVDDDCVIEHMPLELAPESVFETGMTIEDGHEPTNSSLPKLLGPKRMGFWDDTVPYTNFLITRVSFWLRPDVGAFLKEVGEHEAALKDRWGDHRVMGLALRMFSDWDPGAGGVNPQIDYYHDSHRARVSAGGLTWVPTKKKWGLRFWFDQRFGAWLQLMKRWLLRWVGKWS